VNDRGLTIGQLADASGVTVRTLHHYDRIGLLTPSERTRGGHRRYDAADVRSLYRIVALRQLGLSLTHIAGVLADTQSIPDLLQRQLDETTRAIQAHHTLLARLKRGVAAAEHRPEDLLDVISGTIDLEPDRVEGPLRPVDGSPSSIFSMLFDGLDGCHAALRRQLRDMTIETLPRVAPLLFRAITFEDRYVMSVLQEKPTVFSDQTWGPRLGVSTIEWLSDPPKRSALEALREYADAVFTATTAYVTSISEDEVNREIPGPGASALTWSMKVSELLSQVAAVSYQLAGRAAALAR
jgi:DNA-binding transcriptional MerR regulator